MTKESRIASARSAALRFVACAALVNVTTSASLSAQSSSPTLTYASGSSVKLEQVIGDCDYQVLARTGTCLPTTSQTVTRFNVLGNGQGGSFEANGKMIFWFGDTIANNNTPNYHAGDPLAWSTSTDPEAGLLLTFYTESDGSPLFVKPPNVRMGGDNIPNSGITLSDGVYLVCNVGADTSLADSHENAYSILVRFDERTGSFTAGRTISARPGGHFIFTSVHQSGSDVLMFGSGSYRASDVYLSKTPASGFVSGIGTQYFGGFVNGQPTWTTSESGAVPVVQDNPLNGPAWPNDSPTVGNISVVYSSDLRLWLMTYDGGRQSGSTRGVYFTYAQQPWGPWAAPQLIFNENRDNAYGVYIHNPNIRPDPPGDGLNGPTIGDNDPYTTPGGAFAPYMLERFIRVVGNRLKIYYNLSTWNPYTIVRMRSEFVIGALTAPGNLSSTVNGSLVALSWTPTTGATSYTLEAGSRPGASDLGTVSTNTASFSASVGPGVYYVRVRAANGVGLSDPSNEVVVTVGATCPILGPPGGVGASVTGSTVTVRWGGVAGAVSYVLEAGSSPGASNLAAFDAGATTSLTANGVARGTYYVRVRSSNACGTSAASNEIVVAVP